MKSFARHLQQLLLEGFVYMLVVSSLICWTTYVAHAQGVQDYGQGSGIQDYGQGTGKITNPLGNISSVSQFIEALLKAVVKIGLPLAVLFVVLAGFKFISAQGNPEQLATARRNFIHVVIGIAIFIGAWALAQLILQTLKDIGVNV